MSYNPQVHHRQSIRLRKFNYAQPGFYFITICTAQRQMLFGHIADAEMHLNDLGRLAHQHWQMLPNHYPNLHLHDFIIMPNHMHGIIQLVGAQFIAPKNQKEINQGAINQGAINRAPTVGDIVRGFKARVTYTAHVQGILLGAPAWQRNYHEHVIRDEMTYRKIADYVRTNPQRWLADIYHAVI